VIPAGIASAHEHPRSLLHYGAPVSALEERLPADIGEEMNQPALTEAIEGREQLDEFLRTYTPKDITHEEIMKQVMLGRRPGDRMRKFQFCAIDTTPKN
jgi:hypothetical protein